MPRPASPRDSETDALVRELERARRELARYHARDARRRGRQDARLLDAIASAIHGRAFSAAELAAHAAVAPMLASVLGSRTNREIGGRLGRLKDRAYGGLVLRRVGRDSRGSIWSIADVERSSTYILGPRQSSVERA
jgi:hypothetical protein